MRVDAARPAYRFSTLQRVEIAEIYRRRMRQQLQLGFSTLQRVEIAEIVDAADSSSADAEVSVLFNESKLLKCTYRT